MTGTTLDAFDYVPRTVLEHVGHQPGMSAPKLATLRALYRRQMTLFLLTFIARPGHYSLQATGGARTRNTLKRCARSDTVKGISIRASTPSSGATRRAPSNVGSEMTMSHASGSAARIPCKQCRI